MIIITRYKLRYTALKIAKLNINFKFKEWLKFQELSTTVNPILEYTQKTKFTTKQPCHDHVNTPHITSLWYTIRGKFIDIYIYILPNLNYFM